MPGRDRTGPMGAGPRTGRGMGYCGANEQPGFSNQPAGYRGWFNAGYGGRGRGWRYRFFATGIPGWAVTEPEQETTFLKNQADLLKTQLDAIQKRIEELEAK
jgi:Family of unknown function (DUF5320)